MTEETENKAYDLEVRLIDNNSTARSFNFKKAKRSETTLRHSTFDIRYSTFDIRYSIFDIRHSAVRFSRLLTV
jgi:hypothetical protein